MKRTISVRLVLMRSASPQRKKRPRKKRFETGGFSHLHIDAGNDNVRSRGAYGYGISHADERIHAKVSSNSFRPSEWWVFFQHFVAVPFQTQYLRTRCVHVCIHYACRGDGHPDTQNFSPARTCRASAHPPVGYARPINMNMLQ